MVKLTIEEYKEYERLSSLIPHGLVMTLEGESGEVVINNYCIALGSYIHLHVDNAVGKNYH